LEELPTVEECLLKAQEYLALAESTQGAILRPNIELTELAATLDRAANRKLA